MWYALAVFIPGNNMALAVTANDGDIVRVESAAWAVVVANAKQFDVGSDTTRREIPQ